MKININDKKENLELYVFAILTLKKVKYYMAFFNNKIQYIETNKASIIDNTLGNDWIYIDFPNGYKMKKNYDLFGYDQILIKQYIGPKIFIDDKTFLLDILFNPSTANNFFNSVCSKIETYKR